MKTISAYWIPTPDYKYTNYGDILTPYILNKFNINAIYEKDKPQLYGVGSLLHMMPLDYDGHIWTSGMMYNTHRIKIKNDPIAVRGKLTLNQFDNDTTNTVLGDGGLILERIYKPRIIKTKYKLGVLPNYVDIVNMRDNPIENFNLFKNNRDDVILIDPRNYIETIIDQVCSCENIITSSLHGAVTCDSYGIKYGVFSSRETDVAIHKMQGSFKFRDYYSVFNINFNRPDLFLDNNTSIEKCLSICRPVNKPILENIKEQLVKSIDKIITY